MRAFVLGFGVLMLACSSDDSGSSATGGNAGTGGASSGGSSNGGSSTGGSGGSSNGGTGASGGSSGSSAGGASGGAAPGTTWFSEPFESLGPQNLYGFANRFEQSDTKWTTTHLPTGGWNQTGGAHVVIHGCTTDCSSSTNQFNTGWVTPALASLGKPTSQIGDGLWFRWRIRFDEATRWRTTSPQTSAKFLLFGQTGEEPNSRLIIHLFNPYQNGGCSLGFDYSYTDPPYEPDVEWVTPADFGLSASQWTGDYGSFSPHVNIGWDCAPGVAVTHADQASPVAPQHVGAPPVNGWYHLQFFVKSGDGNGEFRIYANNDDEANPSSRRTNFSLHTLGWDEAVDFVGYWGVGGSEDISFIVDDLQVGDSFDPNWYPGD